MKNVEVVSVTRTVKVNLTAKDWLLYDDMPGVEAAAERINRAVEAAVSTLNRVAAHVQARAQLLAEASFGAGDGESGRVLDAVLDTIYLH